MRQLDILLRVFAALDERHNMVKRHFVNRHPQPANVARMTIPLGYLISAHVFNYFRVEGRAAASVRGGGFPTSHHPPPYPLR